MRWRPAGSRGNQREHDRYQRRVDQEDRPPAQVLGEQPADDDPVVEPAAAVAGQIASARFRAGPSGFIVVSNDNAAGRGQGHVHHAEVQLQHELRGTDHRHRQRGVPRPDSARRRARRGSPGCARQRAEQ